MFKRLFNGSRMTRECHVRFCEKPSGFVGGLTHLYLHQELYAYIIKALEALAEKTQKNRAMLQCLSAQ